MSQVNDLTGSGAPSEMLFSNLNEVSNLHDATGLERLSDSQSLSEQASLDYSRHVPVPMVNRDQSMQVIPEESRSEINDTTYSVEQSMVKDAPSARGARALNAS